MLTHRFMYATRWLTLVLLLALCAAVMAPAQRAQAANTITVPFAFTGAEQTFIVPQGVTEISVVAVGGKGGDMCIAHCDTSSIPGGAAARVSSTLPVQPGQTLYIAVAGNGSTFTPGFNGGAINGTFYGIEASSFGGSSGGGASDIRTVSRANSGSLSSRLLVAAGGGGAGPGVSGGAAGQAGGNSEAQGGGAGTLTSGGAGGAGGTTRSTPGTSGADGVFGSGGAGADAVGDCSSSGGGGGGGYYGGGGGGSSSITTFPNGCSGGSGGGGGGGGSSYVAPGATNVAMGLDTSGIPSITISYVDPRVAPTLSGAPPAGTYGQLYSFAFTLSGDPAPSLSVTSGSLPPGLSLNGATLGGTPTQAGTFNFTLTASNGVAPDASLRVSVVINRAALTTTVQPATRQYSDPNPTFQVSFAAFVNGDDASVISGSPSCTTTATPSSPAGQYPITCDLSGMSAANYSIPASASGTLTVVPENTATDYTGDQFVLTAGPKTTTAPVRLAAQLTQEADGHPGDLTLAQVVFELYKSSNLGNTPDLVVGPAAVSAGGAAEASATLAADTWTVKVKVAAGNQYWVADPVEVSTLTIALGDTTRRVTGGGWVADAASANGKGNFGFTVSPDKQGNPKGNAQYIFRGTDGYTYVAKSTSWQGGGLTFFADPSQARFSGKAVIQQIDPATGNVVASQGNTSFTVELIDGDVLSPRQSDQYGITVRTSGGALWKQIALTALGGGNVAVKSK
jgi:hypothetical protein